MVDSVQVWPPGFKIMQAGAEVSGAQVRFFEAGTTTPKEVFADKNLSISLGTIVYTRSDGLPVANQGSTSTVTVYTDTDDYKFDVLDSDGATVIPSKDNVRGALSTALFLTPDSVSTFSLPVLARSTPLTVTTTHKGKLINCNATGGDFTLTIDAAATLGDSWLAYILNSGATGHVLISATQAIAFAGGNPTKIALGPGEGMLLVCDGAAFEAALHMPEGMKSRGPGVITIVDRVSSSPVGATAGSRYIVSGAFGSFTVGMVIEANGTDFTAYQPSADCGLIAYVQDEDRFYAYKGTAWVDILNTIRNTDLPAGTIIDRAYSEYTSNANLSTTIPLDDSIPQNNEGTEILTASITPKSTSNRIRVTFQGSGTHTVNDATAIAALFRDSVADALAAIHFLESGADTTTDRTFPLPLVFEHAPATLSAITYKIRVGLSASGNLRFNGSSSARLFGGVSRATLVVEEIAG